MLNCRHAVARNQNINKELNTKGPKEQRKLVLSSEDLALALKEVGKEPNDTNDLNTPSVLSASCFPYGSTGLICVSQSIMWKMQLLCKICKEM